MMAGGLGAILDAGIGAFVQPVISATDVNFFGDDPASRQGELMVYMSMYFLATIIAMPLIGHILPRYNIRIVLTTAFVLTAGAFAINGLYTEVWQWYISGFIFGLAGSFIFVMPVPILIGNWFFKRRALVLGIVSCFSGIGGALLSILFTFFINEFGWRTAYFASALVICIMVLPFTLFVFRFKPEDMGLNPYGWSEEEARKQIEQKHSKAAAAGPNAGVVANRVAVFSLPFLCMFLLCGLVSFYGSLGTQMNPFGFSLGFYGDDVAANRMFGATLVSAVMIGNIASKIVMGFVTDYIGVYKAIIIQLGLVIVGLVGFIFFNQEPWLLYLFGFFFGVQNSVYAVSTPLLIRSIFGNRDYAKIFSWCRIGTGAIGFVGPTMYGFLVGWQGGSYIACFVVSIVIGLVCILAVIVAESTKKKLRWVDDEKAKDLGIMQESLAPK
jgi:MFS family permease